MIYNREFTLLSPLNKAAHDGNLEEVINIINSKQNIDQALIDKAADYAIFYQHLPIVKYLAEEHNANITTSTVEDLYVYGYYTQEIKNYLKNHLRWKFLKSL